MATTKGGRPPTGSVVHEGGRWKARITLPNGTRKLVPLPEWYDETQARAKSRELAEAVRERGIENATAVAVPKSESVREFGVRYVKHLDGRGLTSVPDMAGHLRNHVDPLIGDIEIRSVKRSDVERVRDALDAKIAAGSYTDDAGRVRRFQWKTAANVWGTVKALFDEATNGKPASGLRVRETDPTRDVQPPERGETKDKQYLYPVEFDRLVACERVPMHWRRLYAVAFYLGMRAAEIEALDWSAVDLVGNVVRVRQAIDRYRDKVKRPKSAAGRRGIPIEANLLPLLLALRAEAIEDARKADPEATEPAGRVLRWMPTPSELAHRTRTYLEWAGVTRDALFVSDAQNLNMRFHDARATYVSWLAIRGDDSKKIQRRAGHSTGVTTDGYIREVDGLAAAVGVPFGPLPAALLGGFRLLVSADQKDEAPESSRNSGASVVTPTGLEAVAVRQSSKVAGGSTAPIDAEEDVSDSFGVSFGVALAAHLEGRTWGDLDLDGGAS